MKITKLTNLYNEWIKSINNNSASKTYCVVEERNTEPKASYYLLGFNLDKEKSESFEKTYGLVHDYGCLALTHILDLSDRNDKDFFDGIEKLEFGDMKKLDKFHK